LWDFLSKRFFFHLDTEHVQLCGILKSDLLKFYLINAVRTKNKEKLTEFFSMYSHEILAEAGNFIPGNLRNWFVLPYMEEPEKDPEFSVYFSPRWSELLRITLHNFLSVVLSSAPPPKLLLLEKWFRSEAQQEMRSQLKLSSKKIDCLVKRIERYEERSQEMREVLRLLINQLHKTNVSSIQPKSSSNGGLFETDEAMDVKREKIKELGQSVVKLVGDYKSKSQNITNLPQEQRLKEILGDEYNGLLGDSDNSQHILQNQLLARPQHELEELESDLIRRVHDWIGLLSSK
jgi:hypothetical protein